MKNVTLTVAALLVAGGLFVGCASAPSEQLTAAQEMLTQAQTAQADLYVADLYQAAQDSLAAAQTEIEAQNAKFALTRSYDRAEALLAFVSQTATTATEQVAERKQTMQAETETLIAQAQETLTNVQALMAKAPRGKEGNMALVSISEDRGTAQSTLQEAIMALQNGDVANAHSLAQTASDKANSLVQELEAAIAKTTRS